jgi:four helix bundle protein
MPFETFRDLDVWRVAMDLAERIHRTARQLPAIERYELSSQMRRAATSIPSNVAEGHSLQMRRRYRHHAQLALGSSAELSTQLELACRLGYIGADERDDLENEIQRVQQLLGGVIREINGRLRARGAALPTVVLLFLS